MTAGLTLTAIATVTMGYFSSPAVAYAQDEQVVNGQLTLYSSPPAGGTETISYKQCQPPAQHQSRLANVTSFDNRPPAGCHVALVSRTGGTYTLCHGRGSVPAGFRQEPLVQIKPGASNICLGGPEA
jgi:hypothetical protein